MKNEYFELESNRAEEKGQVMKSGAQGFDPVSRNMESLMLSNDSDSDSTSSQSESSPIEALEVAAAILGAEQRGKWRRRRFGGSTTSRSQLRLWMAFNLRIIANEYVRQPLLHRNLSPRVDPIEVVDSGGTRSTAAQCDVIVALHWLLITMPQCVILLKPWHWFPFSCMAILKTTRRWWTAPA